MVRILDTQEEIENGTLTKDKTYILVDTRYCKTMLVNITETEMMDVSNGYILYPTIQLTLQDITNHRMEKINLQNKILQYNIPFSNQKTLALGDGKYIKEYKNIYDTKILIKAITIYGLGCKIQNIILIDKPFHNHIAEQYDGLITQLKTLYKDNKNII